ncbi:hypothetical protein [Cellulomonas bogoriensis]|uniref:Fimbrial assembly protein n=1 Tax=Cellulomonas bogoriensis 69B4 = DSM 16987 TaxID=1386082 RepID=A0A0A0C273_9CELL|nr:hypothetical protein [Cellulomonas bogoriensis]KGM14255.1 fimbrial assembly protein [Cellulomonas bogoriensis 69B4 = DSM 16987]
MSTPKGGILQGASAVPQVNLLPAEIRASRSLRTLKRLLALALVGVVVAAAVGFVGSMLFAQAAERELEAERAETARLIAEQRQYSEVPRVLADLDAATRARLLGSSTEILWAGYLEDLMTVSPSDVAFTSIRTSGATPMQPGATVSNPLHQPSVVTLEFQGHALELPDVARWAEQLESIPAFQDAYVTFTGRTEGSSGPLEGIEYYDVTGSVQVTDEAYARRFDAVEEED